MSKLKIMDYRNAKYQGETNQHRRHGLGMLLDDHFTLIIGEWNKNQLHGACVIVYPENIIFYGVYRDNNPEGLCIFQLENQINLYCCFNGGKMGERVVITMEKPGILIEAIITEIRGREYQEEIRLISDQTFKNEADRNKIIRELLKMEIKESMSKGWVDFLDNQIIQKYPGQITIVKTSKSRNKEIEIGYKRGQTLGGSFTVGPGSEPLTIGFYKNDFIFKDLGRKYIDYPEGKIIQEGIYNSITNLSHSSLNTSSNIYTYNQLRQPRPIQALNSIQTYFKQSLSFVNQFVNLKYVYKSVNICYKVGSALLETTAERYAQVQLQENGVKSAFGSGYNSGNQQNEKGRKHEYTVEDMKLEIYNAIGKKKDVGRLRSSRTLTPWDSPRVESSRRSPTFQSPYEKVRYGQKRGKQKGYLMSPIKSTSRSHVKSIKRQESPQFRKVSGGKYQENSHLRTPDKQQDIQKSKRTPNRYKYIQLDNFDDLTQDYENIKREIQRETPRVKKRNNLTKKYIYNDKSGDLSRSKMGKSPQESHSRSRRKAFNYIH